MSVVDLYTEYLKAADEELAKLEKQYLPLLSQCKPVTRREAVDFMATKATELDMRSRGESYAGLSDRELIDEGRFLARRIFDKSAGACVHRPSLCCWAMCTSDEITEILRCLWVPRLIQ